MAFSERTKDIGFFFRCNIILTITVRYLFLKYSNDVEIFLQADF